jgi:drug/metabolite transporter (DMT)-like permease
METNKDDSKVQEEAATIIEKASTGKSGSYRLGILYIVLSILFQSASIVFGKFASLTVHSITIKNLLWSHFYMLTLVCLFLQAITWQQALRYNPLSWSYMFMSCIYPVIMFCSYFIFHEQITLSNLIGALIILIGVYSLLKSSS